MTPLIISRTRISAAVALFGMLLMSAGCSTSSSDSAPQGGLNDEAALTSSEAGGHGHTNGNELSVIEPGAMQLELGTAGDLMRRDFSRDPDRRHVFDEAQLDSVARELDELTVWAVVPVHRGENGRWQFASDLEPRLVVHEESGTEFQLTKRLEAQAELPFVREERDELYFGLVASWHAREGRGVRINEQWIESEVPEYTAAAALAPRAGAFELDGGDVKVEAQRPGIYLLRHPDKGPAAGWTRTDDP